MATARSVLLAGLAQAPAHANAVLTATGYNFRLILRWLRILLRLILAATLDAINARSAIPTGFLTIDWKPSAMAEVTNIVADLIGTVEENFR